MALTDAIDELFNLFGTKESWPSGTIRNHLTVLREQAEAMESDVGAFDSVVEQAALQVEVNRLKAELETAQAEINRLQTEQKGEKRRNDPESDILRFLAADSQLTEGELAERLGVSWRMVGVHLRNLKKKRWVDSVEDAYISDEHPEHQPWFLTHEGEDELARRGEL